MEEILSVFTPIDGTPFAKMILRALRNKIEGEDNELLHMNSIDLQWQAFNGLFLFFITLTSVMKFP